MEQWRRPMKGYRVKLNGWECEGLSRRAHWFKLWRAGARRKLKRAYAKRVRLKAREIAQREANDRDRGCVTNFRSG
jgi:hypothetical protein